ncbi:glycosyltransferase family 4 protein [Clostridium sp. SYSU_GA19001]|uniref:glycosyltransferase family 4 protein n=1 Tax=Clostridium caldaquaticum TaxID=2940653 RepID=UPI00207740C1|nr:glycosyltransferase family 1 protein [Clostridium caldaquaticum]MCM8709414.1 glycosyltransferase family 4 protein [Clostridium caldaquaticum]
MIIFNALQTSLSGGIGRYSYELAKALYLQNEISIKIVIREQDRNNFNYVHNNDDLIVLKGITNSIQRNFYEQFKLPKYIYKKYPNAIIHYPDSMAPINSKNKIIITIHDLAFLSRSQDFTKKTVIWKKVITNISVKKANKIICITNFAKSEIKKYYPDVVNKTAVVYNGFNDFSHDTIQDNMVSNKIRQYLSMPYILTVSTISPRKNIDGLIKAFDRIKDKIPHKLIIAGNNGWKYEEVYKLIKKNNLKGRVFFTGKVNDEELKTLYKNSELFVYPSFYEGFGLPPLEAMSYGVPCIASQTSSIPEVLQEAAIYINPYSIEDLADKLLMSTKKDINIIELKDKGYARTKCFSWEKCARETFEVYRTIL